MTAPLTIFGNPHTPRFYPSRDDCVRYGVFDMAVIKKEPDVPSFVGVGWLHVADRGHELLTGNPVIKTEVADTPELARDWLEAEARRIAREMMVMACEPSLSASRCVDPGFWCAGTDRKLEVKL